MDRRLGRPLPHQLPNPTRADPLAINLSSVELIRYYSQFPGAIPNQGARSHALLTRPPLHPKVPSDLHVLGLPPAFILSQDQTLKLKRLYSVSLTSNLCTSPYPSRIWSFCLVLQLSKQQKPQNSEAFPGSSGRNPTWSICKQSRRRMRPNRPHIPSNPSFQRAQRQKSTGPLLPYSEPDRLAS